MPIVQLRAKEGSQDEVLVTIDRLLDQWVELSTPLCPELVESTLWYLLRHENDSIEVGCTIHDDTYKLCFDLCTEPKRASVAVQPRIERAILVPAGFDLAATQLGSQELLVVVTYSGRWYEVVVPPGDYTHLVCEGRMVTLCGNGAESICLFLTGLVINPNRRPLLCSKGQATGWVR